MKPEKENTTNSDLFDADATDENPRFPRSDENVADLCELSLEDITELDVDSLCEKITQQTDPDVDWLYYTLTTEECEQVCGGLGLGLGAEANHIFSQDSFIPRSLDANLTVEAYGNSYNLIEVGAYAEQLEAVVEKWL